MAFFHGAETRIVDVGLRPVRQSNVGVIGLIGTSPQHLVAEGNRSVNRPVQVLNKRQAVELFGPDRVGYTIPQALNAIFDQVDNSGGVIVIVVNVLDTEGGTSSQIDVVDETFDDVVVGQAITLEPNLLEVVVNFVISTSGGGTFPAVEGVDYTVDYVAGTVTPLRDFEIFVIDYTYSGGGNLGQVTNSSKVFSLRGTIQLQSGFESLVVKGVGGTPTYVLNTDYTINSSTGEVFRTASSAIPEGATVQVSYDFPDPSTVSIGQIIGETTTDGDRTGLQAFIDSFNLFGFFPKILIAPSYSSLLPVTTALNQIAETIDAMAVVDAPLGTSYQEVISGRGPSGTINFNFSSSRLVGCYPHLKSFRNITESVEVEPMSSRFAGVWANKIESRGFWWSPSNTEFKGIVGTELPLEFIPGKSDTEANQLNAVGVVTYANYFGNGIRTWGNRSFAFPNSTSPDNFINIRFAQIVINERIRLFAMQYVDYPINGALIDAILDSINAYFRSLINQGGLLDGSQVFYDPSDNPPQQIADGQLVFRVEMLPSPPAERLTFLSYLNVNLASSLNVGRQLTGG